MLVTLHGHQTDVAQMLDHAASVGNSTVLVMRSLSPTDVRSSEKQWVQLSFVFVVGRVVVVVEGEEWGAESHSPLKLGRLFSLNAAKPSSRSLVGITFERKSSESLMSSKRLGRLTQKMWSNSDHWYFWYFLSNFFFVGYVWLHGKILAIIWILGLQNGSVDMCGNFIIRLKLHLKWPWIGTVYLPYSSCWALETGSEADELKCEQLRTTGSLLTVTSTFNITSWTTISWGADDVLRVFHYWPGRNKPLLSPGLSLNPPGRGRSMEHIKSRIE